MIGFLWLVVIGVSFFAYCPEVIAAATAGLVVFAAFFLVLLVLASRWLIFRPFASVLGGAGRMAAGGVMGAAMASRRVPGAVPVLMARIDAGLTSDVTIKVSPAAEGIRQGDHLQVWGPRILGTVRSVFVRNITAGRLFWNFRAITLPLLLIAVISTPAVMSSACRFTP